MTESVRLLLVVKSAENLELELSFRDGVVIYGSVDAGYGNHKVSKSHSRCTLHTGRVSGAFSYRRKITADSSTVAKLKAAHLAAIEITRA